MSNLEVSVAVLLLENCTVGPFLHDEGIENDDLHEAEELIRTVREALTRLRSMGYDESDLYGPIKMTPEVIKISRDYHITLPSRGGEELLLPPLLKTVFVLFLKHSEGISFKRLGLYKGELMQIYSTVAPGVDSVLVERRVERLVSPLDGSIHMVRSKLSRNLERYFPEPTVSAYKINGKSGEDKFIELDRTLVLWE